MNIIRKFIENNRQMGTSAALIKCALENNGYLIVSNHDIKYQKIKNNPELKDNILTLAELENNLEKDKRPLFFDTDAVSYIASFLKPDNNSLYLQFNETVTAKDLEIWRSVFEDAKNDRDFKIITHPSSTGFYNENKLEQQINIKITEEDSSQISDINKYFFENECSNSMIGRMILRKGIKFYKQLQNNL